MKHSTKLMSLFGASAVVLAGMAGCSKEGAETAGQVVENTGTAASNVSTAAGNQVAGAGNALDNAANSAGQVADNVGTAAGNVATAAGNQVTGAAGKLNTPQIKTDISVNPVGKTIKTLNVDTSGDTITLSGTGSAAAKKVAEQIAKKDAPGYKIVNNIKAG